MHFGATMKILLCGDPHGEYWIRRCLTLADSLGIPMTVFLGDVWDVHMPYYEEYATRMLACAGNHEQPLFWEAGKAKGRCLDDYSTFEFGGIKFGVLGHIDQDNHEHLRIHLPWLYDALGPKPDIWMRKMPVSEAAKIFSGVDVMLTHDGPHPMEFIDPGGCMRTSGSKYLADICLTVKPKFLMHGHYHSYHNRKDRK